MEEKHTEETVSLSYTLFTKVSSTLCLYYGLVFNLDQLAPTSTISPCISYSISYLLVFLVVGCALWILNTQRKALSSKIKTIKIQKILRSKRSKSKPQLLSSRLRQTMLSSKSKRRSKLMDY